MTLALLLRYWKEAAIVGLVLGLVAMCHARDNALVQRGQALQRAHVADSTLRAVTPKLARVDTLLVRDTVRVPHLIAKVDTLRDTLLTHLTDTLLVKEYVTRTDSAINACSDLLGDCTAFRVYATTTIQALRDKLSAQPAIVTKSCVPSNAVSVLLGAAGAIVYDRVRR